MANEQENHRETVAHMLSEFFRELAVLILVFVPLDYLLRGRQAGPNFWLAAIAVATGASLLLISGIVIEGIS